MNRASVSTSAGPKEGGNWIQTAWVRGPSGSIAWRNARMSAATSTRQRSCVTVLGSFMTNRNVGSVCFAHVATVSRGGIA
jgi:hypothetical protein